MPDRTDASEPLSESRSPARRRGALALSAALALIVHLLFLGGIGRVVSGAPRVRERADGGADDPGRAG
jgi:hypothetical protein